MINKVFYCPISSLLSAIIKLLLLSLHSFQQSNTPVLTSQPDVGNVLLVRVRNNSMYWWMWKERISRNSVRSIEPIF